MSIPSMYKLQHLFFNEENCMSYLIDNDILYKQRNTHNNSKIINLLRNY